MNDFVEILKDKAQEIGIGINDQQADKFELYYKLLVEWNQKFNLTAITETKEVIVKHFIDSLLVVKVLPELRSLKLLDLGTGAGFPGVPLKIYEPSLKVVLVDSLKKRIDFLVNLSEELELTEVMTIHGRAEEIGKDIKHREQYDIVVSRAVARVSILSEYCLPFVKRGGKFVAFKGPSVNDEVEDGKNALEVLGGKIESIHELRLPVTNDIRTILVIEKIHETPIKYPRKAGMPEKKPL